jgi:hypothetical protein
MVGGSVCKSLGLGDLAILTRLLANPGQLRETATLRRNLSGLRGDGGELWGDGAVEA